VIGMTRTTILTVCIFGCVLLCACSTAPGQRSGCIETYRFRNAMPCETFKQENLSESFLNVTFTEGPTVSGANSFWILTWNGIDVPLPRTAYEHVYFFKGSDSEYNFRLDAGEHIQISLLADRNDLYEDVFAVWNMHDRTTETSAEGIASTKAMFGGPIRYSELMMRAYATTPDDVTCCLDRFEEETGTVVALIMKSIDGPDNIVAAYNGVGRYGGWITEGQRDGRTAYALNIVPERDAANLYHLLYEMSENAPFHAVPFLVGRVDGLAAAPPPSWLAALNLALQEDSNQAWRKYIDAARKAGLSAKSIQIVEEMLPLPGVK